jgi:hypothetical protein
MPYHGYQVYYAERAKTEAEQRSADAQLGQRAAALARLCRSLASPVHALRHRSSQARRPGERACQPVAAASCPRA